MEAGGLSCLFAGFQNHSADPFARPRGMDEEGADLRSISGRIEERVLPGDPLISTIQSLAAAPATTADDGRDSILMRFRYEISAIRDQLSVYPVDSP